MHLIRALCLVGLFGALSTQQAQDPSISAPSNAIYGQSVLLQFSGTHPPFFLSVTPGDQFGTPPLETIGPVVGTSYSWFVDISPGTLVSLTIRDALGDLAQSDSFTIAPAATTLITTTDSAGNNFTVTGEIIISGNISTTVPCRTVITTNAAGVTVTSTETGSSVLPTELQKEKPNSHALSPFATTPLTPTASISTPTVTAGVGMLDWSNAALVSVEISGLLTIFLVLL
ncbi:hypothetical protein B0T10DRAFT_550117 [Thelonectria olida]|uniref:Uncharacterized protein n=1 Tax=Thelonectria olida TaxID=1576542 RepID=A0A9P9AJY7_9HYPO|nr:hypothetical protein B0T10DRAFT_550117 [Thelonectria olida]